MMSYFNKDSEMKTQLLALEKQATEYGLFKYSLDLADMVTLIDWDNPDEAKEQLREISDKREEISIGFLAPITEYNDESYFVKGVSLIASSFKFYFVDLTTGKRAVPRKPKTEGGLHGALFLKYSDRLGFLTFRSKHEFYVEVSEGAPKVLSYPELLEASGLREVALYRGEYHRSRIEIETAIEYALETDKLIYYAEIDEDRVKKFFDGNPSLRRRVYGV